MGRPCSSETCKRLSEAHKGERNPNYGKYFSEETRRKLSEAQRGKRNHFFGKHHTVETRKKISEAHKDKPRGEETRRKISIALMGRSLSADTRKKMSKAWTPERRQMQSDRRSGKRNPCYGKHPGEETRAKMSIAQKKRWHRFHIAKHHREAHS